MLRVQTLDRMSIAELDKLCELYTRKACQLFELASKEFDYNSRRKLTIQSNIALRTSTAINAHILRRLQHSDTTPLDDNRSRERSAARSFDL